MDSTEKDSIVTTVVEHIRGYFPASPVAHITSVVGTEYDALNGSRIRGFIPNLVQHNARERLHAEFANTSLVHAGFLGAVS